MSSNCDLSSLNEDQRSKPRSKMSLAGDVEYQLQRLEDLLETLTQDSKFAGLFAEKMKSRLGLTRLPSLSEGSALITFLGDGEDDVVYSVNYFSSSFASILESNRRSKIFGPSFNPLMDQVYAAIVKQQDCTLDHVTESQNMIVDPESAISTLTTESNQEVESSAVAAVQNSISKQEPESPDLVVLEEPEPDSDEASDWEPGSEPESSRPKKLSEFQCDICFKKFPEKAKVKYHRIRVHTKNYPIHCDKCGRGFAVNYDLMRHKRRNKNCASMKKKEPLARNDQGNYQCDFCGLEFYRGDRLKYHRIKVHTHEYPIYCEICSQGFVIQSDLNYHLERNKDCANKIRERKRQVPVNTACSNNEPDQEKSNFDTSDFVSDLIED